MKIAVVGLWHLGCVTAACLAKFGHTVLAFDENPQTISNLKLGIPPLYEPGLSELIHEGIKNNLLNFINIPDALKGLDIIWITYDTSIDDLGQSNVDEIKERLKRLFPYFNHNSLVIISSQVPVGTTQELKNIFLRENSEKNIDFVYSPENLRLGKSIDLFLQPDRIVMGIRSEQTQRIIKKLLKPIADKILWMSVESAEMTKHAINAFLSTSIVFINELAVLCESFGADANSVAQGLKTDIRIGPNAYLTPGGAFSGGTLARDVHYLKQMSETCNSESNFFQTILFSNLQHKNWIKKIINKTHLELKGKKVAILGLAYKPGTDSLRNSSAVEISLWLKKQGSIIHAYDPAIKELSAELKKIICLQPDLENTVYGADAIIIGTECKEFLNIRIEQLATESKMPYLFDVSGFLSKQLENRDYIKYFRLGCFNEVIK
jgi:UDPglucose 6-dehydrogenase